MSSEADSEATATDTSAAATPAADAATGEVLPQGEFAERLEYLYDTRRPPRGQGRGRGGRYSNPQVAEILRTEYGCDIGQATLSAYRTGQILDPSDDVRLALEKFFNAPPSYLARKSPAGSQRHDEETPEVAAARALVRDPRVLRISQRVFDLDERGVDFIDRMVEEVHAMQQDRGSPNPRPNPRSAAPDDENA